jgi:hypothetical protein
MSEFRAKAEEIHATLKPRAQAIYVTPRGRVIGSQKMGSQPNAVMVGRFTNAIPRDDFVDECLHTLAEMRGRK